GLSEVEQSIADAGERAPRVGELLPFLVGVVSRLLQARHHHQQRGADGSADGGRGPSAWRGRGSGAGVEQGGDGEVGNPWHRNIVVPPAAVAWSRRDDAFAALDDG